MKVKVRDQQGADHEIEGTIGWTLLEAIRGAGLSVKAECGGTCSCATCHVYIDDAWAGKLPEAAEQMVVMVRMIMLGTQTMAERAAKGELPD